MRLEPLIAKQYMMKGCEKVETKSTRRKRMSKEDLGKLIDSKKFSKTMYCYGDDKLGNFIKEIYFDGMREGYNLAKFRLELLDGMPFDAADEYWDNNMEKIRNILNLCKQYDEIDKQKND